MFLPVKAVHMSQKIMLSLGLTLAIAAAFAIAPILSEMAYALTHASGAGGAARLISGGNHNGNTLSGNSNARGGNGGEGGNGGCNGAGGC
jgi:hypothetical protein